MPVLTYARGQSCGRQNRNTSVREPSELREVFRELRNPGATKGREGCLGARRPSYPRDALALPPLPRAEHRAAGEQHGRVPEGELRERAHLQREAPPARRDIPRGDRGQRARLVRLHEAGPHAARPSSRRRRRHRPPSICPTRFGLHGHQLDIPHF